MGGRKIVETHRITEKRVGNEEKVRRRGI